MARSFLSGEFAGGESAWWRGDWIPCGDQQFLKLSVSKLRTILNQENINRTNLFDKQLGDFHVIVECGQMKSRVPIILLLIDNPRTWELGKEDTHCTTNI